MRSGRRLLAVPLCLLVCMAASPASASREFFTPEQKARLEGIQTILVEAVALTDKGIVDAGSFTAIITRRLNEVGYSAISDRTEPHDVVLLVKCEEHKTWEGTTADGGDADLPDSPSRLWKGPACRLTYMLGGLKVRWQREVRTEFDDAAAAAQAAQASDPAVYALGTLQAALTRDEFPLHLSAEWGHADRLLKLLDASDTNQGRRLTIISILGDMQADDALPKLKEALKDQDLAKQALVAIGNLGKESIPLLIDILTTSVRPEIQAAAAKGLGQIGGLAGEASVVPPLLEKLQDPNTDWVVLTEVAWALGKIPDKRAIQPLYDLDKKLQAIREPENMTLKKLKEAVFWSIKQCDTWDQYSRLSPASAGSRRAPLPS